MRLIHIFVEHFPEPLEAGKLYVSMQYASAAHLCACGCGHEVVTPIRRRDGWKLVFDGESISLSPSIGSRNLACRSHYFITHGQVRWALPMDQYGDFGESHPETPHHGTPEDKEPTSDVEVLVEVQIKRRRFFEKLMFWRRE